LGVVITSFVEKKYPWYQAPFFGLAEAFNITWTIVSELSKTVFQLISFQKPKVDVAGPIGIARYTGEAIKFGSNAVLELIALLSLNLAVVNILPFPALDGGRLAFVLYEIVTKRRVNQNFERNLNLAGMIILIALAILISIHDVIKIYR
jgi:regulator of sigma E protease